MGPPGMTARDTFVEDTYITPQFGFFEFLRRARKDQLLSQSAASRSCVKLAVSPQAEREGP